MSLVEVRGAQNGVGRGQGDPAASKMAAVIDDPGLLRAVIDRIVPGDAAPGALALGTDSFVLRQLAANATDAALVARGLASLQDLASARGATFETTPAPLQDALLEAIEGEVWFVRLVTITAEGFFGDPDNGGNAGAASWRMIGYRHGLPEGPSGPPAKTDTRS